LYSRLSGFREYWDQIMSLMQAHHWLQNTSGINGTAQQQRQFQILHTVAGMGNDCPVYLAKLILLLYPEQVFKQNEDGRLPIHEAAAATSFSMQPYSSFGNIVEQNRDEYDTNSHLIHMMISIFPASAQIHDGQGRLPLTLALASGKIWIREGNTDCQSFKHVNSSSMIQRLFTSEPRALSTRDQLTRLYPFMIAAAMSSNILEHQNFAPIDPENTLNLNTDMDIDNMDNIEEEKTDDSEFVLPRMLDHEHENKCTDYLRLSTIYEALRADPAVLNIDSGKVSTIPVFTGAVR